MSSAQIERTCTMLVHSDKQYAHNDIRAALEGSDTPKKVEALKRAISMLLNGEQMPSLFITIVRYVLPSEDHTVQRLLLLYLETIDKTDGNGKLLPEMILICQNLRNNLQHPNEYLRGVTLRFLCRIHEEEILEPLVPSVLSCLDHRHSFVRRNAVLAINEMYKLPKGELLLQDAPEHIEKFLLNEQDLSARRNALMMLTTHAVDLGLKFLYDHAEQVVNWGGILQIAVLELICKGCISYPEQKGRLMKVLVSLLQSSHTSVVYEAANTLVSLSQAPTAVKAAATCYCQLLVSQSDTNVKLIVLDRLQELKEKYCDLLQDMLMDILRALSSPVLEICRKALGIAMDLITSRNVDEVVMTLKKEIMKSSNAEADKSGEYRQILVQAIHTCAVQFPDVAGSVVHLLMDFLGDTNPAAALDVVFFVREIIQTHSQLKGSILERLCDTFYQIRSPRVASCTLWILGEFSETKDEILATLEVLKQVLGPLPFFKPAGDEDDEEPGANGTDSPMASRPVTTVRPAVLADGTYATQTSIVEAVATPSPLSGSSPDSTNLRSLLLAGDFFLGSVLSASLTKLMMRLALTSTIPTSEINRMNAEWMLYMVSILQLGDSQVVSAPLDMDSYKRITACLRVLAAPSATMRQVWLEECRKAYVSMLAERQRHQAEEAAKEQAKVANQPDDLIDFHHLKTKKGLSQLEVEDALQTDLQRATGASEAAADGTRKLNRVLQLTGLSDAVYAEAYVTVHQYDIVLDVTIINRSKETLQNLCLELATMGDLKLVERPQNYTLAPAQQKVVRANIKVSSTETGVIFGNIVYEAGGYSDRNVVVLNDIHIDIMDYISPASCPDVAFRNMWAEFEWENKVAVNTSIKEVTDFLDHIVESTNMRCLTPTGALDGECGYLTANLYAKSVFGEDALVNVSVEKQADGRLAGYIRIRSKTQGIALSLGDKITLKQKGPS